MRIRSYAPCAAGRVAAGVLALLTRQIGPKEIFVPLLSLLLFEVYTPSTTVCMKGQKNRNRSFMSARRSGAAQRSSKPHGADNAPSWRITVVFSTWTNALLNAGIWSPGWRGSDTAPFTVGDTGVAGRLSRYGAPIRI
jgi:hypothetical protein